MFGQDETTGIPLNTIPKPDLPGYKTDEQCSAALAAQKKSIADDMKTKHMMLFGGGVAAGALLTWALTRR